MAKKSIEIPQITIAKMLELELKKSVNLLSSSGVIVLDDSEREEYKDGVNYLLQNKFKRLDFWGIAPTVLFKKCTSLFYLSQNCLGV